MRNHSILLSILVSLAFSVLAASDDLTFEKTLDGWTASDGGKVVFESRTSLGTPAVRLDGPVHLSRTLELAPNTRYELSFFVKGEGIPSKDGGGARIALNGGKIWKRITASPGDKPDSGTFDWRKGTEQFDTSDFPGGKILLQLTLPGSGKAWFSDLKLTKLPEASSASSSSPENASFRHAYGESVKSAALVPQGVFGFFEPDEPVKVKLHIEGKAGRFEYTLSVRDDTGKTVLRQEKQVWTEGEIVLPAQPCGYYSMESDIYAGGTKAYTIQGAFVVAPPAPEKRDPFFQFGYGAIGPLHDGYKRIGCGSIALKFSFLPSDPKVLQSGEELFPVAKRGADYNLNKAYKPFLDSRDFALSVDIGISLPRKIRTKEELDAGYPVISDRIIKLYLDVIDYLQPRLKIKDWVIGHETPSNARMKEKYIGTWSEAMGNFVTMVRLGSRRLRKLDPEIRIHAGDTYMDGPSMGDIVNEFDQYYINAYTGNWDLCNGKVSIPEIGQMAIYKKASALSVSLGKGKYVANEETGYAINYGAPFDAGLAFQQARFTARSMIISKAAPVTHYQLFRPNAYGIWDIPKSDADRHMNTIWKAVAVRKEVQWVPLPGGAMYATLASELAFAQFAEEIISGGVYCYLFTKPDGSVVVTLWNVEKEMPFEVALPSPFRIRNLYGRDVTGGKLVIGPDPVYITLHCPVAQAIGLMKHAVYANVPEFVCAALPNGVYVRSFLNETREVELQIPGQDPRKVKILPGRINEFPMSVRAPGRMLCGTRQYDVPLEEVPRFTLRRVSEPSKLREGTPGVLRVPDHVRPAEALQPERGHFRSKGFNPNGHDVSAKYWAGYDDENFYLAVEVDDPVHIQRQVADAIWKDDSIQFVLSPVDYPPSSMFLSTEKRPSSEYNFGLALTSKGPQLVKFLGKDKGIKDHPAKVTRNGDITLYEVAIPWKAVGGRAKRFGFLVFDVNDLAYPNAPYRLELTPGIADGADSSKLAGLVYDEPDFSEKKRNEHE